MFSEDLGTPPSAPVIASRRFRSPTTPGSRWWVGGQAPAGFALGTLLGIGLAVVIVHNDASDGSLRPWIIASQTVPILAIAPMVVVGLGAVGVTGQGAHGADLDVIPELLPGRRRHVEGAAHP